MRLRVLSLALVLVVAAGCGGTKTYEMEKTRDCLKAKHLRIVPVPGNDFVANAAEGDAVSVRFPDNQVTISFGNDRKGAERIVRAYQRFRGQNIGLTDVLSAKRNAVILWGVHPKESYVTTIEGCLK